MKSATHAVLLVIDGLEAVSDPPDVMPCALINRLAMQGTHGRLLVPAPPRPELIEYAFRWGLFSGTDPLYAQGGDPPLGYLTALGLGLQPDPDHTWARLCFTHLMHKQDQLRFVSPERTGQIHEERQALVTALEAEWADLGW